LEHAGKQAGTYIGTSGSLAPYFSREEIVFTYGGYKQITSASSDLHYFSKKSQSHKNTTITLKIVITTTKQQNGHKDQSTQAAKSRK
jgi:hypothetical protein